MNLIHQHIPNSMQRWTGKAWKRRLRFAMVVAMLLSSVGVFAQHDVALEKYVDRDSVKAGDTVTWTLHLFNQNLTDVTGLQVRDTLLPGLTYLSHSAPAGTSFDVSTGIWNVGAQLNSNTAELTLTIKTRVESEGMYMNIAEVTAMDGTDVDSEPNNNELLEDDMHKACVSVPITICSQLHDSVRVTLLPMFTNIQWFKDGVLIPASAGGTQDTFYIVSAGIYAFTATQNGCPTLTCCPVVVKDSCYDLALRKTLAIGQNDIVNVGSNVNFTLEITNQGDLPAHSFSIIDYVDLAFFASFNLANNPPGQTSGSAIVPYAWTASGTDGKVTLNGTLSPGEVVKLPVTLKVAHGGQAANFAEINSDDDRDLDSQPESQEQDGNGDHYVDDEILNGGGDEDDHDGATLTIIASALGDFVWHDTDHDGQQDSNETGVSGVIVHLYTADSTLVASDTTDANGHYFFNDLAPGNYYVEFVVSTLPPNFIPTLTNTGNDVTDSDAGPSGWTSIIKLEPGEVDPTIDFGVFSGDFDLALTKNLAPGQSNMVDIGQEVHYFITVSNQGLAAAQNIVVTDHIPAGMVLAANNPGWTLENDSTANYTFASTLAPGQSNSVEIVMLVIYGGSGASLTNIAEIIGAEDEHGVFVTDVDSTPGNGTDGEDDLDDEIVELSPHDPTGWIYCDKTGRLIPGGKITVTGPNGIPNSQVFLIHDGSEGFYEFYTNGTPGVYTISYSHPLGYPLSPDCPPLTGPFDPTGLPNPVVLGSDTLNMDYIEDKTCAGNPYYMSFEVQPGDPIILHNNLPVQCILIASIVCEDANHNDQIDAGDQPIAGATVTLYSCANPNTPILTTVSDSLGRYRFDGLDPGSYMVGYNLTPDVRPVFNGPINPNGFSQCITLNWGQCDTNTVICLYECPDVDAGPDMAQCSNSQSSQLSASVPYGNGSFTWSPTAGLSNSNIANPIAMPSATATYTVTFNDGNGCVDSDAMTIQIGNPFPFVANAPFADTTIECSSPLTPFEAPLFVDGCDAMLDITLDSTVLNNPCGRTITRIWTATNDNGNSVSFTQTVNVVDNTPPVMFATHSFFGEIHHGDTLYADCTQIPSLDSLGFSAYDFCSATTHNFTENVIHGNCTTDGFLENRYCGWTATDACGNTDSLYFHVIISDNQAPVLAGVPADVDMPCGQAPPPVANVTATDLCAGNLPVSFNELQAGSGCATTITRTWSAVDACGNSVSASQIIHLSNDNLPPILAGVPANTTATCGSIPPAANVTATDNCDTDVTIAFNESIAGGNCNYVMTRTWTATDDCGYVTSASQTINLTDDDAPVLVGLPAADITASCGYLPAPPTVTATDGCDPNVPVIFTETQTGTGCAFTVTRKWTASDDCNHTTSFTQTIHVVDDKGPVISVISPGLTWLADGDTIIRQCNQVFSLTANSAKALDACCSTPPTMTFHEFVTAGNCQTDGYLQLMTCGWTATDCCGNVDSLFFTVIVKDTIAPKLFGVPADLTLACGQTLSSALPNVVAQDACSSNLQVSFNSSTVNVPGGYILTRTWSSMDHCGNIGTKSQVITVTLTDVVPPVLANVPSNLSLNCGASIPPAANNVTATDFCDAMPTITFSETTTGGASCGTITRTWTATDDAGNSSSASQTITISDTQAPVFAGILPQNMNVECNAVPVAATLTATDNCDANVLVAFTETQQGSNCSYTLTRTWTATDDCGNQSIAQQIIHVSDTQAPVFVGILPQNISVECNAIPAAATLTATDNCDANVPVVFTETQQGTNCSFTLIRTWAATDDCGNVAVVQQILHVSDTKAPVFNGVLPQNMTVECNVIPAAVTLSATDNCDANVPVIFTETQNGSGCSYTITRKWTATDDCGNQTIAQQILNVEDSTPPVMFAMHAYFGEIHHGDTLYADCTQIPSLDSIGFSAYDLCGATTTNFTETVGYGNCPLSGFAQRRYCGWTATDACGNTDSLYFTVIIYDPLAPIMSGVPADTSIQCGALPAAPVVTATDNCSAYPTVSMVQTTTGPPCDRTVTRTWTAEDACGNTSLAIQNIHIADTIPPVFYGNLPQDMTVACGQLPLLDAVAAKDNCDTYVEITYDQTQTGLDCEFVLTRIWTATDDCGNTSVHKQTITVLDTETPYFLTNIPSDITVECGQIPAPANMLAYDNCDEYLVIDFNEVQNGSDCNYTLTRTWTATDFCGLSVSGQQVITVIDTIAPFFLSDIPADTTVACGQVPLAATILAADNCDTNLVVNFEEIQNGTGCNYTLTRTWTTTDHCGLSVSGQQVITVIDTSNLQIEFTNPLLSGLKDGDTLTISCSDPTIFDANDAIAVNGCSDAPVIFKDNGLIVGDCPTDGFIVLMHCTWTAVDTCGDTASISLNIKVVDNMPPAFSNLPADLTVNCSDPIPLCGNPMVTDDCGNAALSLTLVDSPTANGFDRVCTWTATDDCGNIATASSTIHVVDNAGPSLSGVPADSTIYLANGETVPLLAVVTATDGCPAQPVPVIFSETSATMGNDGCMTKLTRTWTATDLDGNTTVQQQQIIVVGFNDANVVSAVPDTCGMDLGSAILAPANYDFAWNNGGTGAAQSELSSGNYSVTATNPSGCVKVLTVNIGNIQMPLTVTGINTTPETCTGGDGTAAIAPASYDYAWSDGGNGALRSNLTAGNYSVTATNGTCSLTFTVNIVKGCDCVPAVLDSLETTNASCGASDGSATLNLLGNVADYGYLWLPNLGVPNASGNARTALPAGHYVVITTYQGNSDCVEKFEFDIFDDCPKCAPLFNVDTMTVTVNAPNAVCIQVPFALLSQNVLEMDGAIFTGTLEACDLQEVVKYGFEPFPTGSLAVSWRMGTDTLYTIVDGLGSVANFLNEMDADGHWYFDKAALRFVSSNLGGNYGKLKITHLPTGQTQTSKLKKTKAQLGTSISLTVGIHELVLSDTLTGCTDTLNINANELPIVVQPSSTLRSDTLQTKQGEPVKGYVLLNDDLRKKVSKLSIAKQPDNGSAWVNVDNTVSYRPLIEYCNSYKDQPMDVFNYEVCLEDGTKLQATVSVQVLCVDDAPVAEISLYPNPASKFVYLDLSQLVGNAVTIEIFNNLGVKLQTFELDEVPETPVRLELENYAAGHYAVRIKSYGNKTFVRQMIISER